MTSIIKRRSSVRRRTFSLAAPTLSASAQSDTTILLGWSNVAGEDGYSLERSPNGVSGWSVIYTAAANVTAFLDTLLTAATIYYYRVRAFTTGPVYGPYSNIANATTFVVPPPGGSLPFSNETITSPEITPYRVIFTDDSLNYSGFEGVLLNDLHTILTTATVAEYIGGSLSKFRAVMGVSDLSDFSTAEILTLNYSQVSPAWSGTSSYPNDIGIIVADAPGFTVSAERQPIEYSAAPDTTPYGGEYFYPPSTSVVWSSNLDQSGGTPSVFTVEEGTKGEVMSDGVLDGYGFGTDYTNIGVTFTDTNQGSSGSGLIVAGYVTNYFVAGVFLFTDDTYGVAVFTRVSYNSNWIYSVTGINPIIYP